MSTDMSSPQHARSSRRSPRERRPTEWCIPAPSVTRPTPIEVLVWAWFTALWALFEGARHAPRMGAGAAVLLFPLVVLSLPPMAP